MPLTNFQKQIFAALKSSRNPESYIAGGTAIHRSEDSLRFSNDIDLFHDTDEAVTNAYQSDKETLKTFGYKFETLISQPSFYRAVISKGMESLKLEWVRDTAFRFFPVIEDVEFGYCLHEVDLAVNKSLALANRSVVRDALDMLELHKNVLSLAGCCWAACGKDPGFTPDLMLEMIQRHGSFSPNLLAAESVTKKLDPIQLKKDFINLLEQASNTLRDLPADTLGCIFIAADGKVIKNPTKTSIANALRHYGTVKGSWPRISQG